MVIYKFLGGAFLLVSSVLLLVLIEFAPIEHEKRLDIRLPVDGGVDKVVLFAGYPGCTSICPRKLSELKSSYTGTRSSFNTASKLVVLFVDLEGNHSPQIAQEYAQAFHPTFIGWQPPLEQRTYLIRALGIFYAPAIPNIDRPPRHSGMFYLLHRDGDQWLLKYAFQNSLADREALTNLLSRI